jgi:hypothetical protein
MTQLPVLFQIRMFVVKYLVDAVHELEVSLEVDQRTAVYLNSNWISLQHKMQFLQMDGCVRESARFVEEKGSKLTKPRDATISLLNTGHVIQRFPISTMIGGGIDNIVKSL